MSSSVPHSRGWVHLITRLINYFRSDNHAKDAINDDHVKFDDKHDGISVLSYESFETAMGPQPLDNELDGSFMLERFDSCDSLPEACHCSGYYYTNVSPCEICSREVAQETKSDEMRIKSRAKDNTIEMVVNYESTHSCTCKSFYYQNVSPCSACVQLNNKDNVQKSVIDLTPKKRKNSLNTCNLEQKTVNSKFQPKVMKLEGNVLNKIKSHKRTPSTDSYTLSRRFIPNINPKKSSATDNIDVAEGTSAIRSTSNIKSSSEKKIKNVRKNELNFGSWPSADSITSSNESFKPLLIDNKDITKSRRNSVTPSTSNVHYSQNRRGSTKFINSDIDLGLSYKSCVSNQQNNFDATSEAYFSACDMDDFVSFKDTQNCSDSLRSLSYKSAINATANEDSEYFFEIPKKVKDLKKKPNKAKRLMGDLACSLCCLSKWVHMNSKHADPLFQKTENKVATGHMGYTYEEIYDGALCTFGLKLGHRAVRRVNNFKMKTDIDINII